MSEVIKCIHLVKRCHTFYGDARDARGPGADPGFKKGGGGGGGGVQCSSKK